MTKDGKLARFSFCAVSSLIFFGRGGGGEGGGGGDNGCLLFHFILSKTWSLAFIFRVGITCGYNCNAEANQESINGGKRVLATVCF